MATVLAPVLEANDPRLARIQPRRFGPGQLGGVSGGSGGGSAGGGSSAPVSANEASYTIESRNWRQQRVLVHLCDVWEPVYPRTATQRHEAHYYVRRARGVYCRFRTKSAIDEPQLVGLLESSDLLTVDTVRFAEDQEIDTSWVLVNKTLRTDGTQSDLYGLAWEVRGEPKRTYDWGSREAGAVVCYVTKLQKIPPGVS